jgi:hypothetical protein
MSRKSGFNCFTAEGPGVESELPHHVPILFRSELRALLAGAFVFQSQFPDGPMLA